MVYGLGFYESYGYPAGSARRVESCEISAPIQGDGFDNDCDGRADEELDDDRDDDHDGYTDEDTAVTPLPSNAPPVAYPQTYHPTLNATTANLVLAAYDANGDALTYEIVTPPTEGTVSLSGNRVTWTNLPLSGLFAFRVSDGQALSNLAVVVLDRTTDDSACGGAACNHPPVFMTSIVQHQNPVGGTRALRQPLWVYDVDLDPLAFTIVSGPAGLTVDTNGVLNWATPVNGNYNVSVRATDSHGASGNGSFQLQVSTAVGAPPTFSVSNQTATENETLVTTLNASGTGITYMKISGPAGLTIVGNQAVWTPPEGSAGFYTVVIAAVVGGVTSPSTSTFATYQIRVLGSDISFTSAPPVLASMDRLYFYRPTYTDANPSAGAHAFALERGPDGMTIDPISGRIEWTPSSTSTTVTGCDVPSVACVPTTHTVAPVEPGIYEVQVRLSNAAGDIGRQAFAVEVTQEQTYPQVTSSPVSQATVGAIYIYDVEGYDYAGLSRLTYSLADGPPDMDIDPVTGLIQWLPTVLGSFPVTIRVADPFGVYVEQSYVLEVQSDTFRPTVRATVSPERIAVGESSTLSIAASDDVGLQSLIVYRGANAITLDANGQRVLLAEEPGTIRIDIVARDLSGNETTLTKLIAVTDPSDTTFPVVSIDSPSDDAVVSFQTPVTATISDANLFRWTLTVGDVALPIAQHAVIATGEGAVAAGTQIGTIDATRLENGIYQLTLTAEDVSGNKSTATRPIRVEGGAKVGLLQLAFTDLVIPAPGFDVSVVRTYDTRRAAQKGDFGYGWELDLRGPQVRNNRPIGQGLALWSDMGDFVFPCTQQMHQKSHYTEVRISETEFYVFSPFVANVQAVSGRCTGEIAFEQVDGTAIGATLSPMGDNLVMADQAVRVSGNPPPLNLLRFMDQSPYNETHFQMITADGRIFDLTVENGLNWVQDANSNTLFLRTNRIESSSGRFVNFTKDSASRITRAALSDGTGVSYQYNTLGDLRVVTDGNGLQTRLDYSRSQAHYLSRITDPDGVDQALFTFDEDGRMIQSCGAESHCIENRHDLVNKTEWFIDGEEEIRHTYDARGNVLTETNALNETWTYTYDADDHLLTATSPLGEVTVNTYDGNGNLLTKIEPHESSEPTADFTTTYEYDAGNRRTKLTMPSGGVLRWVYDPQGNLLSQLDGQGNEIRGMTYDSRGRVQSEHNRFGTTSYGYTNSDPNVALRDPTSITDSFGRVTALSYDNRGRVKTRTENGLTQSIARDAEGRTLLQDFGNGATVSYGYDGARSDWSTITGPTFGTVSRTFWPDGKLQSVVEPNGDRREYFYDVNRRLRREVDELGHATDYKRDRAGRVTEVTEVATGAVTKFAHDAAGRVTKRTDALNRDTTMTYRAGGRLASLTDARMHTRTFSDTPTSRTVVDALNRTTVRSLSAYGLTTGTSLPGGTSTSLTYLGKTREDESQRFPLSVTDEGSRPRTYGYDANGGMTSATDLGGANGWQYTYALTKSAQIVWDAESGSVDVATVDGRATAYEASSADSHFTSELKTVRTPRGDVTTFNRDTAGRPSNVILPWGATKSYSYTDNDTLPETVTLPQGTVLTFSYDSAKRETKRTSNAGESRTFTYGTGDRLQAMTDATGTTSYGYDSAGRFSGITYPTGGSVTYTRDVLGRVTRQEVKASATSTAEVTLYSYDAVGNLGTVTDPLGGVTTFTYDAENRLTTRTLPNGVVTTYTYDARDRPLSVVHKKGSTVLASRTYVRAAGGEPTKITKEDGSYVAVGYDSALRIVSENYFTAAGVAQESVTYAYDADGNRTTKTKNGVPDGYTYLSGARMTAAGTSTYGNDTAGRVTNMTRPDGTFVLAYDSDDHVTSVTKAGVATTYGFDAMGRRTSVTSGGVAKRYLVAPNMGAGFESPQMVTDASGVPVASFVFAGEQPLMKIVGGVATYYLGDSMGSVIGFADAGGASTGSLDYDGFGNARGTDVVSASTAGDFRFQGMWKDPTGLYYVRARMYEAETGRFTSRDPAAGRTRTAESYLPYSFANSDPHVWLDPTGRFSIMNVVVGVAVGVALAVAAIAYRQFRDRTGSKTIEAIVIDDTAGTVGARATIGEIRFSDPASLVDGILEKAGGEKISRLNIQLHGGSGKLWIGDDISSDNQIFWQEMERLRGAFEPDGFVHIQACNCSGRLQETLARLSTFLGVPVYGGTGTEIPLIRDNTGDYFKCEDGTCTPEDSRPW